MPFTMNCSACGEAVEVADEHRGWRVRCPVCGSEFQAGELPKLTPPTPAKVRARRYEPEDELYGRMRSDQDIRAEAAEAVSSAARTLEIVAWLGMLLIGIAAAGCVLISVEMQNNPPANPDDPVVFMMIGICFATLGLPYYALMAYGARHMRRLSSYGWSMASAIMATMGLVLFGVCGLIQTPIGVWALVVINRPEVKAAFFQKRPYEW